jgi:hypothetical protein
MGISARKCRGRRIARSQHREQDGAHECRSRCRPDRSGKLHRGRRGPEKPGTCDDLHGHLHHRHGRAGGECDNRQHQDQHGVAHGRREQGDGQQARGTDRQADGWQYGGSAGAGDRSAAEQGADGGPEGQRQQQQAGVGCPLATHDLQIHRQERHHGDGLGRDAGRQEVGAPDPGLTEHLDRQQRCRRPTLLSQQQHRGADRNGDQACYPGDRSQVESLRTFQGQQDRDDDRGEQGGAPDVELEPPTMRLMGRQPRDKQRCQQTKRDVDQKHGRPAEFLGKPAAGDRPERRRGGIHAGQVALVPAALAGRYGLGQQGLRQGHQPAAAQALQQPAETQHQHAGRQGAKDRCTNEHAQRPEHHALAAEGVTETAVDRGGDGVGEQVGDDHP